MERRAQSPSEQSDSDISLIALSPAHSRISEGKRSVASSSIAAGGSGGNRNVSTSGSLNSDKAAPKVIAKGASSSHINSLTTAGTHSTDTSVSSSAGGGGGGTMTAPPPARVNSLNKIHDLHVDTDCDPREPSQASANSSSIQGLASFHRSASVAEDTPVNGSSINNNSSHLQQQSKKHRGGKEKCLSIRLALAISSLVTLIAMIGCGVGFYFVSEKTLEKAGLEIGVAEIGTAFETLSYQLNLLERRLEQIETVIAVSDIDVSSQEGLELFFNTSFLRQWTSAVVKEQWILGFGIAVFWPEATNTISFPQVYFDQHANSQREYIYASSRSKTNISDATESNVLDYRYFSIANNSEVSASSTSSATTLPLSLEIAQSPFNTTDPVNVTDYRRLFEFESYLRAQQWQMRDNAYHYLTHLRHLTYKGLRIVPVGWLSISGTLAEYEWANKSQATVFLADNDKRIFTTNHADLNEKLRSKILEARRLETNSGVNYQRNEDVLTPELGSQFPDSTVSGIFSTVEHLLVAPEGSSHELEGQTTELIERVNGKSYFVVHTHLIKKGALHLSLVWFQEKDSLVGELRFNQILLGSLLVCALLLISLIASLTAYQAIVRPLEVLKFSMQALTNLDLKKVTYYEQNAERQSYSLAEVDSLFLSYRHLRRTVRDCIPFLPQPDGLAAATSFGDLEFGANDSFLSSIGELTESTMTPHSATTTTVIASKPLEGSSLNPLLHNGAGVGPHAVGGGGGSVLTPSTGKSMNSDHPLPMGSFSGAVPGRNGSRSISTDMVPPSPSASSSLNSVRNTLKQQDLQLSSRAVIAHFQFGPEVRACCMDKTGWKDCVHALQMECSKIALDTKGTVFHLATDSVTIAWTRTVQAEPKACGVAHKIIDRVKERLRISFPNRDLASGRPLLTCGIAVAQSITGSTGTLLKKGYTVESEAVYTSKMYSQVAAAIHAEVLVQEEVYNQAWMFGDMRPAEVIRVPPFYGPLGDRAKPELRTLYQSISSSGDDNDEWMYVLEQREKDEATRLDRKAFEALVNGNLDTARELYREYCSKNPMAGGQQFLAKKYGELRVPPDVIDLETPSAGTERDQHQKKKSTSGKREGSGEEDDDDEIGVENLSLASSSGPFSPPSVMREYFEEVNAGKRAYYRDVTFQDVLPMKYDATE